MYKLDSNGEVNPKDFSTEAESHDYIEDLAQIDGSDTAEFENVGVETDDSNRSATFILKDLSVVHCKSKQEGIEVLKITEAMDKYDWLKDYMWKDISPEKDIYTQQASESPGEGFFIRAEKGVVSKRPVQTCLHISKEGFAQNVHNIVIVEEGAELHVIAGCSTARHAERGLHIGVSEFYVKKGATLKYTMVHDWGEKIFVRPRTVTHVDEGGVYISNYISMKPVGSLQMNPITYLDGKDSIARFNSVLVAAGGTDMDTGSVVVLGAENARAEIISRAITTGGNIIARGSIIGNVPGVRGHLECKGLILNDGLLHAIPELEAHAPNVEMSHEAAVGKIDQREIEYLMARGLDEDEAISTIVRGFLNVDIEGLPPSLVRKLDRVIADTQDDMM